MSTGPLRGLRVVELGGIGPVPHTAMVLGDLGADVVRIQRPGGFALTDPARDHLLRSRRTHALDLKSPDDRDRVLDLAGHADVLLEGFRPGVAERLGLGPDELRARNPRLVYGRMTGWGRGGPFSDAVGHDINYIAANGTLHAIGPAGRPPSPHSTLSAISAAGRCCCSPACWPRSGSGSGPGTARSSTPRWSTGRPCSCRRSGPGGAPASGPTSGRRTCSTAPPRTTGATAARTAASSPSARSSPRSTPTCSKVSAWSARTCPTRTTAPDGPRCGSASRPSSPRDPATSGRPRSPTSTPA